MKVPRPARHHSVAVNMTPMIDVVFQLIIFFLVSSHLAKQEVFFPLRLPLAQTGKEVAVPAAATINILPDGTLLYHSRPVTPKNLEELLAQLRQDHRQPQVRIRADRDVPYRYVQPVLRACWQAGVQEVTFSVYRQ
ncbi:MAG: biopolymer transporter ExbD [Pirellulaceae bacterium]|nr:MAG: biopolymer transporter ExbD [Pirellulaceae bacterium]